MYTQRTFPVCTYSRKSATAENRWPLRSTVTFAADGGSSGSHASCHWPSLPHHKVSSKPKVSPDAAITRWATTR